MELAHDLQKTAPVQRLPGTKTKPLQQNKCDVLVNLRDHSYCRKRISAHQAEDTRKQSGKRPRCSNDQVHTQVRTQCSSATTSLPKKRKLSSQSSPSKPSAELPVDLDLVQRPGSSILPADLPVLSSVPPSHCLISTNHQPCSSDGPVKIHNHSVEEYQQVYHEVVDPMLRYKSGRVRPYSLDLGRRIKQKLWERLDRPTITTSASEDRLVHVDVSYGGGVYPPLYHVDTLGEPSPDIPPSKRSRT